MTEVKDRIAELQKDQYVQQWLSGLAERTKENCLNSILLWNEFIGMTPTEQIKKRIEDKLSTDLSKRQFFEQKFREYKTWRETEGKKQNGEPLAPLSIKTELNRISSFFSRNFGKRDGLSLMRGDWCSTQSTRIKNKLSLKLEDIKSMYAHGTLRDRCLLLVLSQSGFSEVDVTEFHIEDMKGFYEAPISLHYFLEKCREKTGEVQATCLSYEFMHDIRDLLAERGNPKEGYLFTSQTKEKGKEGIEVRRIHEAMKNLAEKALGSERAKEFKTKHLRSLYNSALLRADIKQEVKDLMMGHQRLGARGHYGYDEQTIIEAYQKAFEHLSINGMQSREDLAKIKADMQKIIGEQQVEMAKMKEQINEMPSKIRAELEKLLPDIKKLYS